MSRTDTVQQRAFACLVVPLGREFVESAVWPSAFACSRVCSGPLEKPLEARGATAWSRRRVQLTPRVTPIPHNGHCPVPGERWLGPATAPRRPRSLSRSWLVRLGAVSRAVPRLAGWDQSSQIPSRLWPRRSAAVQP